MRIVDPLRQPEMAAAHRGVVPPFLPTLGLALVAGLLSLVCREPAETPVKAAAERPPVMAVAPGLSSFDPGRALLSADLAPVPASEAFARLVPLVAASEPPARPAQAQAQASARLERRRPAPSRLAATPPAPATASVQKAPSEAAPAAMAAAPESRRLLPGGALPFADAADAVWDAARSLGTGATSLGSSVTVLVSELR